MSLIYAKDMIITNLFILMYDCVVVRVRVYIDHDTVIEVTNILCRN